ncbi:hypothetical protein Arth_4124 [Arthrobacter sp. FB24]|uniref:glycosyltransferase n=1 Tax=Arthrobacter sp. (strain FB24) TaxID=290399 RepID=UPI0000526BA8|nr:glycosyltransferase [Arthrobacter sp. FB24]ABK05499.1 hypothetical protein Arth_4124 [Arthrobacter sp. FB24]
MSAPADHVLLTRFNLPSRGAESRIRAKDGWLKTRLGLFESYCLPSVRCQSNQNFHWIIYFDPQSPAWLRERIAELNQDALFTPIFRAEVSSAELLQDLHAVTGARHNELLTTNLDNDDGLASDFVERLQAAGHSGTRTAIYLVNGLIRCGSGLYLRTDRANAFCSVREDWAAARTCWSDWHNLLGRSMSVKELAGDPAWLQLVHDSNVSNRIRGRRVSPEPYRVAFGGLLDGVPDLSAIEEFKDLAVGRPRRFVKESGRLLVKKIALNVLGKEGLDQLKSGWALRPVHRR